jgi:cytidine deaminase
MSKKLRKIAIEASKKSHSPYSKVQVGSAVETEDGSIFGGCNIENSSFGGTVCAERVAIWNAVSSGNQKLKKIYVYTKAGWPPCGMCLQVMSEFAGGDLEIIIGNGKGNEQKKKLKELLTQAFTPDKLLKK